MDQINLIPEANLSELMTNIDTPNKNTDQNLHD